MITEILDNILTKINIPFYDDMPDFSLLDEPDEFIVYNYSEIPNLYADDEETVTEFDITLNIFTKLQNKDLYKKVKTELKKSGFTYCGDIPINIDSFFPGKHRKIQKYRITIEE